MLCLCRLNISDSQPRARPRESVGASGSAALNQLARSQVFRRQLHSDVKNTTADSTKNQEGCRYGLAQGSSVECTTTGSSE